MSGRLGALLLLWLYSTLVAAAAVVEFDEPAQQARYNHLVKELRCTVCQNQNLLESHSDLAADLRGVVAEQVMAGASEAEIKAFMVQRYGEFVLFRPSFAVHNWLLWLGPALLFALGVWVLRGRLRRHAGVAPVRDLTPEQRQRLQRLLRNENEHEVIQ